MHTSACVPFSLLVRSYPVHCSLTKVIASCGFSHHCYIDDTHLISSVLLHAHASARITTPRQGCLIITTSKPLPDWSSAHCLKCQDYVVSMQDFQITALTLTPHILTLTWSHHFILDNSMSTLIQNAADLHGFSFLVALVSKVKNWPKANPALKDILYTTWLIFRKTSKFFTVLWWVLWWNGLLQHESLSHWLFLEERVDSKLCTTISIIQKHLDLFATCFAWDQKEMLDQISERKIPQHREKPGTGLGTDFCGTGFVHVVFLSVYSSVL